MESNIYSYYGQDLAEARGILEYIVHLIETNNNTDFLELSFKQVLERFGHPSEYCLNALACARSPLVPKDFYASLGKVPPCPLILHGVVISSKQLDRTRSSIVLVDEETFESCGSTNDERLKYLNNHRNTSYLLYAYSTDDNKTIGKICDVTPCSRVYVSLIRPTISNTNSRMIIGEIVDAIYDNGECDYIYNDDINVLHGKEDYFRLYNTYRERIIEYIADHDVQSLNDLPSDFSDIIIYGPEGYHAYYKAHYSQLSNDTLIGAISATISEIRAADKEEKYNKYLQNKSRIDATKTRADYEKAWNDALENSSAAKKEYKESLGHYIDNGTDEQKKHAKTLKSMNGFGWLAIIFLCISAFFVYIFFDDFDTVMLPPIGIAVGLFALFFYLSTKKDNNAEAYFKENDPSIIEAKQRSEAAERDSYKALNDFNAYKEVEKYERRNNIK